MALRAAPPPWMLTLLGSKSSSLVASIVTIAKASLISNKSTSDFSHPVISRIFSIAPMGASVNFDGSMEFVLCAQILAIGFRLKVLTAVFTG